MIKTTTLSSILIIFSALLINASPVFNSTVMAQIYDAEADRTRKAQQRPRHALSEKLFRYLGKAQQLIDRKNYEAALDSMEPLGKMTLNAKEEAQYWSFHGYIFFLQKNYSSAIIAYEKILQLPGISIVMEDTTVYTLARLHFMTKDYKKSISYLYRWLKYIKKPGAEPYKILRASFLGLDQKYEVLRLQQKLLSLHSDSEGWVQLAKICAGLITNYTDQSPLSVAELRIIQSDALDNVTTSSIEYRKNYSGGELPIEYALPLYPRKALVENKSGEISLLYDIDDIGQVTNIRVISSTDPVFNQAAITALQSYKYNPENFNPASYNKFEVAPAKITSPPETATNKPWIVTQKDHEKSKTRKNLKEKFIFSMGVWAEMESL